MRLITDNYDIDFQSLGLIPTTTAYDQVPGRRVRRESVIDRDGNLTFYDGLNDKRITVRFFITPENISNRRDILRGITPALLEGGNLIMDYENDIYWKAKVDGPENIRLGFSVDEFAVTFIVEPRAFSVLDDEELTWEDADFNWALADLRWDGADLQSTFSAGTHTVYNRGNTDAPLVVVVSGAGTVTVGTQSFTVTESCTVDSSRLVVYSGSTNKMGSFTGDFIELPPGTSTLTTDVSISIENKDRWV